MSTKRSREEVRVLSKQLVVVSPQQCANSEHPECPAFPGLEKHRRAPYFYFPLTQGQGTGFPDVEGKKRAMTTVLWRILGKFSGFEGDYFEGEN